MTAVAAALRGDRLRPTIFVRTFTDAGFSRLVHQERRSTMSETQSWKQLFEKIIGSWVSRAIYAAAKLRIADHLAADPRLAQEIAASFQIARVGPTTPMRLPGCL
jgi:hypothetical protein